jgi:hypothetical protein
MWTRLSPTTAFDTDGMFMFGSSSLLFFVLAICRLTHVVNVYITDFDLPSTATPQQAVIAMVLRI